MKRAIVEDYAFVLRAWGNLVKNCRRCWGIEPETSRSAVHDRCTTAASTKLLSASTARVVRFPRQRPRRHPHRSILNTVHGFVYLRGGKKKEEK